MVVTLTPRVRTVPDTGTGNAAETSRRYDCDMTASDRAMTEQLRATLAAVDAPTAVVLARAFTAHFQLVNVTEQLHRWQEVTAGSEGPLVAAALRIGEALDAGSIDRELVSSVLERLEYRPVFTAHPTEASRRTVLDLLRRIADTAAAIEDPRRPAADLPRVERRLAKLVDLLWQTDELRIVRPEPTDEARTALYHLYSLAARVVPDLLAELGRTLAATSSGRTTSFHTATPFTSSASSTPSATAISSSLAAVRARPCVRRPAPGTARTLPPAPRR